MVVSPMNDLRFARVTVRRTTGGPVMTVEGPAATKGRLWCTWKEGPHNYGAAFAKTALAIVDVDFEAAHISEQNAEPVASSFALSVAQ